MPWCGRTPRKGRPPPCWRCSTGAVRRLLVCGVDEAGKGPLAGPVYAAAVILDSKRRVRGLADSKVLAPERRAVESLNVAPEEVWVDGTHCPELRCRARAIVDGDALHPVISAASILAKTARDALMCELHERYPQYGFERHKGYATPEHLEALARFGPCEIHRRTFRPARAFFEDNLFGDD